jgi:hypothetical protein
MDGLEVINKIREFSDIPIIISSARSDFDDKNIAFENGADDYLPKPYGLSAGSKAVAAASISLSKALAKEQMTGPFTFLAIRFIASQSPLDAAAKPASIISTFRRANCSAICNFSWVVMEKPGACSPSLKVVSNI